MNIKYLLCFHDYKLISKKSNFYGEIKLYECKKCKKRKCKLLGYPDMGLPSKTTYEHYNLND